MKNPLILIGLLLLITLNSCVLEKRIYRSGLHIEALNKSKKNKNTKDEFGLSAKSNNESHIKNWENSQIKTEELDLSELTENLTASTDDNLNIIKQIETKVESENSLKKPIENEINFKEIITSLKKLPKKNTSQYKDQQTNGMAVAGFTMSLVGLFIFGFILGVLAVIFSSIGLSRTINDPEAWGGKGLATAGLIIGIIDIIGWLILIAILLL